MDREYLDEVEEKGRYLSPILKAARQSSKYRGLCHMENDVLIIDSTRYTKENLHELPKMINGYHAMSKRNKEVIAGLLEAAYSLNWGVQNIWGKDGGGGRPWHFYDK